MQHSKLLEVLAYDAQTGIFTCKVKRPNCVIGGVAGTLGVDGRRRIYFHGKPYWAHRLAWFYVHAVWPIEHIDHIDGNPRNNAISNLREATNSLNMENQRRARADSRTGLLGVVPSKSRKRFGAEIFASGKRVWLGSYASPEIAHEAYVKAKRELHAGCTI